MNDQNQFNKPPNQRTPRLGRRWQRTLAVMLGLLTALMLSSAPAAYAFPGLEDARINGTDCNLIDAIIAANTDTATGGCAAGTPGPDTIDLLDNVTLVSVNSVGFRPAGLPEISSAITINGNGFTIARDPGAPDFSVIIVESGGTLTLNATTISGGRNNAGSGIFTLGALTVNNSTISGNHSTAPPATGGASGIQTFIAGTATLNNSTVSGNTGDVTAGHGAVRGTVTLNNSTVSNNVGGVNGLVILNNSIVADPAAGADCIGTITSLGYNLDSDGSCGLSGVGDIANGVANLGPLQVNAPGNTATHALLAGSQAIDAATSGPATDQRGVARPQGASFDIGAFELEPATPVSACYTFDNRTTADGLGHNAVFDVEVDGNVVYAATVGGLSISTDGGATFVNRTTADGLGSNFVQNVAVSGNFVYAASNVAAGLSVSSDGGATFTTRSTADGLGSDSIFGMYASGSTVYVSTFGGLSISTDGGTTFVNRTLADGLVGDFVIDVFVSGSTVYAATPPGGLSISTDGGVTFVNRTTADGLGSDVLKSVFGNGSLVLAGSNFGLSVSTDGGVTFVNRTTADGLGSNRVEGVFGSGSVVYAGTQGGLSISTDGGVTFTNYTTANGLGNNFVSRVTFSPSTLYAATFGGLSLCEAASNQPPVANAGPDQSVFRNDVVTVSGTWTDPNEATDNPYTWSWDLDGDAIADDSGSANYGDTIVRTTSFAVDGVATLTFSVTDKNGATHSDTVDITVVNRAPTADNQTLSTNEDTPLPITLTGSDDDGDSLTYTLIDLPSNGTLSGTAPNLTYTPNANYFGSDSFTFQVNDGLADSNIATVSITVNSVNDPAVAVNDSASTDEDVPVTVDVQGNDSAGPANEDQTLGTTTVTDPANGTAVINGDGTVTYTPDLDYNGSDSFDYTVCDSEGSCATATVTVLVETVNDPPTANDDSVTTDEDTPVTFDVLSNDSDVDGNLNPASVSVVSAPSNGTLTDNGNGSFTYMPDANFNGSDGFTYQVCDADGICDSASVNITVNAVNDAPVCTDVTPSVSELWPPNHQFEPVTVSGVTDLEGDAIIISVSSIFQDEPTNGTGDGDTSPDGQGIGSSTAEVRAERQGNGNGRYYHITISASDGNGGSCDATVKVSVPKNQGKKGAAVDDGPLYDSTDSVGAASVNADSSVVVNQSELIFLPLVTK